MQGDQVGAPLLVSMQPEKQRLAIKAELWGSQLVTPALGGPVASRSVVLSHSQRQLILKQAGTELPLSSSANRYSYSSLLKNGLLDFCAFSV